VLPEAHLPRNSPKSSDRPERASRPHSNPPQSFPFTPSTPVNHSHIVVTSIYPVYNNLPVAPSVRAGSA